MAYRIKHTLGTLAACMAALAPSVAHCLGTHPPQGLYQVDQEFTMHAAAAAANAVELVKKTDGSTGDYTVTRRASADGATASERHSGDGPVRACVRPSGPPSWLNLQGCATRKTATAPGGHEIAFDCTKDRHDEQWQQVDERTWQHRYAVPVASSSTPRVPAATLAALAPAVAALEERVRNGPPAQAEQARKQLNALRGEGSSSGAVAATVVERWKRVADSCPQPN